MSSLTSSANGSDGLVVGVLALQGAYAEHASCLNRLSTSSTSSFDRPLEVRQVRTPEQLAECSAIIIPGGESTAISLGAQRAGLLSPLREWVRSGKPAWGTCAGMILLAREAVGGKKGGQELLGGMDVRVGRNGFGSQVASFEQSIDIPALAKLGARKTNGSSTSSEMNTFPAPFPGVFIRAPVVESLLLSQDIQAVPPEAATLVKRAEGEAHAEAVVLEQGRAPLTPSGDTAGGAQPPLLNAQAVPGAAVEPTLRLSVAPPLEKPGQERVFRPPLEILCSLPTLPAGSASPLIRTVDSAVATAHQGEVRGTRPAHDSQIVAVKQGRLMATSFHPELTTDVRLHDFFIRYCVLGDGGVVPTLSA
ncbi:Imidazoleglycerol-phosphate synthase subunit H-like [Ceraceosorus bombacis]|uniref:glutaminase n=1 Tax=Ceraceosorus bombacis TaxID=401625 RepID=A0A0P1B7J9_9BASI|nr:Imidazoleglycerol-phosphate synthase subunit H-like [Ceraceosorus bombacis]